MKSEEIQNSQNFAAQQTEANEQNSTPSEFTQESEDLFENNSELSKETETIHNEDRSFSETIQAVVTSYEISHQKGVIFEGEKGNRIPGRFPLMPLTFLNGFFLLVATFLSLVHFIGVAPQFILPLLVFFVLFLAQLGLYHSAFRLQRLGRAFLHTILAILLGALITCVFLDRIRTFNEQPRLFLWISIVLFDLIPSIMVLHWSYLGRSYRWVKENPKVKRAKS